jgi:hypothetical protein
MMGLGWVINVVVAEYVIRRRVASHADAKAAPAPAVLMSTIQEHAS